MCLYVIKKNKPKIATEDIYTLKWMNIYPNNDIYSPMFPRKWKLGSIPKRVEIKVMNYYMDIGEIDRAFYSYDVNKAILDDFGDNIFLCKIPKGTLYYQDYRNAQVASEKLVLVEQIYAYRRGGYYCKDHIDITKKPYEDRMLYLRKMIKSYGLNTEL